MLIKKFALLSVAVSLMSTAAFSDTGNCQHPYCNGPISTPVTNAPSSGPTIYNPRYCYQGNCYPGAYVPGAVDKDGNVDSAQDEVSSLSSSDRLKQELTQVGVERFTAPDYKPGVIRHIVLFRYSSAVSAQQKLEVKHRFLALKALAKRNGRNYIVSIDTGAEISGEGADQNLEQGFIVTFKSEGDRNYYVGQPIVTDARFYDPAHQAFKDFVGPLLDQQGALVFDFAVGK